MPLNELALKMTSLTDMILLLLLLRFSVADEYYVIAEGGDPCPSNDDNLICNTLDFYANQSNMFFTNDVIFYFLEGTHVLNLEKLVVVGGVSNLTLQGRGRVIHGYHETVMKSTVQIKCSNASGFAFEDCEGVTLSTITITECGGLSDATNLISTSVYLTLDFNSVLGVTLEQVSVLNGTGIGLLSRNTYGITIRDSSFSQNESPPCQDLFCPGGNVQILYFDDADGDNSTDINIKILNSNFSFGYTTLFGWSGGIGLIATLTQSFVNLNILIDGVVAFGNTAIVSPNLNIELTCRVGISYNIVINNTISTFGNGLRKPSQSILDFIQVNYGGFHFFDQSRNHAASRFEISNSEFSHNDVSNYGGIQLSLFADVAGVLTVYIENCAIFNNTGDAGAGLYAYVSRSLMSNVLPHMSIRNLTVENNKLHRGNDVLFGAVLIQNFNVTFSQLNIANNEGTGLVSLASIMTFNGLDNTFQNNTGINGGGLALYESSFIILQPPVYITFIDNKATSRGGGIYIGKVTYTSSVKATCFYQLPNVEQDNYEGRLELFFSGNEANISGNVLYGGSLNHCFSSIRFNRAFNYTLQTGNSVISSDAIKICFCVSRSPNCNSYRYPISVVPGEIFSIPVAAVGQNDGVTPGVLQLTDYTLSTPTETYVSLPSKCSMVNYITQFNNDLQQVSNQIYLTLPDTGNPLNDTVNKLLEVTVLPCPPGFALDGGWCQCEAILMNVQRVECNVTTQEMTRYGSVWIGYNNVSKCTFIREDCPFSYCFTDRVTFQIFDPNPQCALNRSGILCGACADGLSLLLGSDQCGECSNVYLLLIVVFALAGFGLVALLLALNLTVSLGTINGLIFYANIVKINDELLFPNGPIPILSQFIAWINLDFGIQSCFFDGMTALDKAWLHFVFPVYIWVIIIVLIGLAHYSTKVSKLLGNSAVPVLATLMLLAYSKIFRASITALNGAFLYCGLDYTVVWYHDPNIEYYNPNHVSLMIFGAIFLFVLALPYTLMLLFNHPLALALNADACHSCGCRSQRLGLRHFFEAFNSPYKSKFTFWTGLLLLVRFIVVFIVAFTSNTSHPNAIIIMVALLLSLQAIFGGVYKSKPLDILEASFLLNIIFIIAFADDSAKTVTVVTVISITLAIMTTIGIVVFHIILRFKDYKYINSFFTKTESYIKRRMSTAAAAENLTFENEDVPGRERSVSATSIQLRRRETLLTDQDLMVRSHKSSKTY